MRAGAVGTNANSTKRVEGAIPAASGAHLTDGTTNANQNTQLLSGTAAAPSLQSPQLPPLNFASSSNGKSNIPSQDVQPRPLTPITERSSIHTTTLGGHFRNSSLSVMGLGASGSFSSGVPSGASNAALTPVLGSGTTTPTPDNQQTQQQQEAGLVLRRPLAASPSPMSPPPMTPGTPPPTTRQASQGSQQLSPVRNMSVNTSVSGSGGKSNRRFPVGI